MGRKDEVPKTNICRVQTPRIPPENNCGNSETKATSWLNQSEGTWRTARRFRDRWKVKMHVELLEEVNCGAFGSVCKSKDEASGAMLAIKRLNQPFQSLLHAKRALRELKLLRSVEKRKNLITLVDAYTTSCCASGMIDLYLVTPLEDFTLRDVIKQYKGNFPEDRIALFIYQILRGLKYLHSANIVHRDLKPENTTVSQNEEIKIIDFGLARKSAEDMTSSVQTLSYRAPELIALTRESETAKYTYAVDIWSVGCILAELVTGCKLFDPRTEDSILLLREHIETCGTPDQMALTHYVQHTAIYIQDCMGSQTGKNFSSMFGRKAPKRVGVLGNMLAMNPSNRCSATDALKHPFFAHYSDPADELPANFVFDDSFEELSSIEEVRRSIFAELQDIARHKILTRLQKKE